MIVCGVNAVRELLHAGSAVHKVMLAYGPAEEELRDLAVAAGVPVERAEREALDRLARGPGHQGVVAVAPPFPYCSVQEVLRSSPPGVLVLDGVQDPRNLGAILRSARAAGIRGVVLPQDRSVGVTSVVATASAGHVFGLTIAQVPNVVRAMGVLRDAGYWLVGLVPGAEKPVWGVKSMGRVALVVGGEGSGLRPLVARTCDLTVSIPMAEEVESLNVSVAVGIVLYELFLRRAEL